MRIVTRAEIQKLPEGTIHRQLDESDNFVGEWMRHGGECGPDFLQATIGPSERMSGYYASTAFENIPAPLREAMPVPKGYHSPAHFVIDDSYGREGLFDDKLRYMVLDEADVKAMIEQLTVGTVSTPTYLVRAE